MRPWEHVVVALLPVVAYSLARYQRLPGEDMVLVVFFASLLPDIVDKPLAWTLGILPSGRMLAHSLVVALPVILLVVLASYWLGYAPHGLGFAWGYLSHLAADFYPVLWQGRGYSYYPNMFWPIMDANPDRNGSFGSYAADMGYHVFAELVVISLVVGYIVIVFWQRRDRQPT